MVELIIILGDEGISRRRFLKIMGGAAVAAGAAAIFWEMWRPKGGSLPEGEVRPNVYTEEGKSLVSIVKGSSETSAETLVRNAVDAIGGIGKVVTTGKKVVVKPAVLTSDANCAPDPGVVAAVVKIAKEAGGTVVVAESSGNGSTSFNLSRVGITSAAVGTEVRALSSDDEISIQVPRGRKLQTVKTYKTIYNCDVLISVPRLKRHGNTRVTISLKNMMGAVTPTEMQRFHSTDLSQCIADFNTVVKPDLTVVDATSAMTRSGPTGGNMVKMDTIIASGDPVAVDRLAAQRLQELEQQLGIASFDPAGIEHINAAAELGVGTNNLNQMKVVERSIS